MRRIVFGFCSMLMVGSAILLIGCQQVAWKPGAGAAELNRDTAACRAQSDDDAAVKNCLRTRGWSLRGSAAGSGEQAEDDSEDTVVPANDASASQEPKQITNGPVGDKLVPVSPAPSSSNLAPTTSAPTSPAATMAKPVAAKKPKVVDPLKQKLVQSWWKVGAAAPDLAADQAACVDTLGSAHQPDQQKRLFTQGLIDCMRARGWSSY